VDEEFLANLSAEYGCTRDSVKTRYPANGTDLGHGDVVIARSRAAPTPPTLPCWSPPGSSPARRASGGWTGSRG
jgi:hypothetical protein